MIKMIYLRFWGELKLTEKQRLKIKNDLLIIDQVIGIALKEEKCTLYLKNRKKELEEKLKSEW